MRAGGPGTVGKHQCTRNVEAFLKKTDIAYRPNPSKKAKFWWYAISVFFKNASTLRVCKKRQETVGAGRLEWGIMTAGF